MVQLALYGSRGKLMAFEITEHHSRSYGPRTYYNAGYSDLTIAFAVNFNTAGEIMTEKASKGNIIQFQLTKDFDYLKAARELYKYMKQNYVRTVNIAGNGLATMLGYEVTQRMLNRWVYEILKLIVNHVGINFLRTGGQTGADTAGSVAAYLLDIPALITYPNGYRQRLEDGSDIIQSKEAALDTIVRYAEILKKELEEEEKKDNYK